MPGSGCRSYSYIRRYNNIRYKRKRNKIIRKEYMDRIKTGINELDKMIGGFPAGKTILITGDAGSGKTIFGLQFANISCEENKKTAYISTEECAGDLRQQGKS